MTGHHIGEIPASVWKKIVLAHKVQALIDEAEAHSTDFAFDIVDFCFRHEINISAIDRKKCRQGFEHLPVRKEPVVETTVKSKFASPLHAKAWNDLHGTRKKYKKAPALKITGEKKFRDGVTKRGQVEVPDDATIEEQTPWRQYLNRDTNY